MAPEEPRRTLAVTRQALPRGAATARAQVRDTRVPLLSYTDRSPRAWATHDAEHCWSRPKTGHGHTRPGLRRILLRIHRALPEWHALNAASWERSWVVSLFGRAKRPPPPSRRGNRGSLPTSPVVTPFSKISAAPLLLLKAEREQRSAPHCHRRHQHRRSPPPPPPWLQKPTRGRA